jgi:DNA-binding transcriptional MerR regulator
MSVGYRTHKKGRPLSPTEVGKFIKKAKDAGASLEECAKDLGLRDASQVSRFYRVYEDLSPDLLHLVSWGRNDDSIGFTTAVELTRIKAFDDQHAIVEAILEQRLETDEVRQVAQIRRRSQRPIKECIQEILGMRPTVERVYVFMGAVVDEGVKTALGDCTQEQRNNLLNSALKSLGLSASGRLGEQFFTIVGDKRLNAFLNDEGREVIESRLRSYIKENIGSISRVC